MPIAAPAFDRAVTLACSLRKHRNAAMQVEPCPRAARESLAYDTAIIVPEAHAMADLGNFSLRLAHALRAERALSQWGSGAELQASTFGHAVRAVARDHCPNVERIVLTLSGYDGRGTLIDVGRHPSPLSPSGLPGLAGTGTEMALTVAAAPGRLPDVVVESFLDGRSHGYTADCPSRIEVSGRSVSIRYHFRGHDFSGLFEAPVVSLWQATSHDLPERRAFVPGTGHRGLVRLAQLAEARGEALLLRSPDFDEARLVRGPGEKAYSLRSAAWTCAAVAGWTAVRLPVLSIRSSAGTVFCSRQVGGVLEGATVDRPAALASRTVAGRELLEAAYFRDGSRLAGPEPTMVDRLLATWSPAS